MMDFLLSLFYTLISSPLLLLAFVFGGLICYILLVIVYRLTLHPLARYPGPLLARITDLHLAYYAYLGNRHLFLYDCHQHYGSPVRVGPNTLSLDTATALKAIYGFKANVIKSDFYKAFPATPKAVNVHSSRDKKVHARKRRVLSHAFGDQAIKNLERWILSSVRGAVGRLAEKVDKEKGDVIVNVDGRGMLEKGDGWGREWNMANWCNWMVFDIMGDLVFGKAFGMMESERNRFAVELVGNAAHRHLICGTHLTLHTLHLDKLLFPKISSQRAQYMAYSKSQAMQRTKQGLDVDRKDFFYHLLQARDPETGAGFSMDELWGESNLLIIAGSDTTSTAIAATFFYLSRNPEALKKVQQEVRSVFKDEEEIVMGKELSGCTYLRAVIDEAMRLTPPVAGFLPREVLPGGIDIDGVHYPAGTVLGVTHYAIHRNEAYFPNPQAFIPERWLASADQNPFFEKLDLAHSAFCPFSIGPRGCIGKGLAYVELGIAVARVVWGFEMKMVDGEKGRLGEGTGVEGQGKWLGRSRKTEFQIEDRFASCKDGPILRFRRREDLLEKS